MLVPSAIALAIIGSLDSGQGSLEAEDFLASLDGTLTVKELAVDLVDFKVLYLSDKLLEPIQDLGALDLIGGMLETQATYTVDFYVICEVQILIRSLDEFPQVSEAGARSHTATHLILPLERGE